MCCGCSVPSWVKRFFSSHSSHWCTCRFISCNSVERLSESRSSNRRRQYMRSLRLLKIGLRGCVFLILRQASYQWREAIEGFPYDVSDGICTFLQISPFWIILAICLLDVPFNGGKSSTRYDSASFSGAWHLLLVILNHSDPFPLVHV